MSMWLWVGLLPLLASVCPSFQDSCISWPLNDISHSLCCLEHSTAVELARPEQNLGMAWWAGGVGVAGQRDWLWRHGRDEVNFQPTWPVRRLSWISTLFWEAWWKGAGQQQGKKERIFPNGWVKPQMVGMGKDEAWAISFWMRGVPLCLIKAPRPSCTASLCVKILGIFVSALQPQGRLSLGQGLQFIGLYSKCFRGAKEGALTFEKFNCPSLHQRL